MADILIYVALPEKRASFAISEELKPWLSRKRWFFALNKIDLFEPEELEQVSHDFESRVSELGFEADQHSVFLISALKPKHPHSQFERMRLAAFGVFWKAGSTRWLANWTRGVSGLN